MSKGRVVYREFGIDEQPEEDRTDLPPQQQNVRVQVTRHGKGGKTVTEVTGFQTTEEILTKLTKQLKNQCGSGGTCKEQAIEIQGDHSQKILQILLSLGYKAKISGK
ncbi:translation initiation factor [Pseudanabaena sp. FACHB-1277]|uniref:Translation initiation factor n=1 Tax=Pseudanabaena cinerea FACHB-1277 TaxID=2949581 RepID=A0A926UTN2_9CYAN|nr:translation initiation factor [Pseudanabaena cinerea]MBD2150623.1 translation initiation factor [Pseudanabaena cinerea FACHB-1277]